MTIRQVLFDERIDDNTTVIINDVSGLPITCGRWYEDRILDWSWKAYDVSFEFVEGRNIAILQIL